MRWPWQQSHTDGSDAAFRHLEKLFLAGRLTYEAYRDAVEHDDNIWKHCFDEQAYTADSDLHYDNPALITRLREFSRQLLWDYASHIELTQDQPLWRLQDMPVTGARFLYQACEVVERFKLPALSSEAWGAAADKGDPALWTRIPYQTCSGYYLETTALGYAYKTTGRAARSCASIIALDPEDDPAEVVRRLRQFTPETLMIVLPVTTYAAPLVLDALGQHDLAPLWQYVLSFGHYTKRWGDNDIRNSPDTTDGIVDLPTFTTLVAVDGDTRWKRVLALLETLYIRLPNTIRILEAAMGKQRAKVLDGVAKRAQPAIKAYGILPLEHGEDECLERYLTLQEIAREARQFGAQRQTNQRAAVQVALANLAQVAGYADVTRLEWAMEARLAQNTATADSRFTVDDYVVALESDGDEPVITVSSGDRALKSVPDGVRKSAAYRQLREMQESIRAQVKRFRWSLEETMVGDEVLSWEEIQHLTRLPAIHPLLRKLIFLLDERVFGLFDPATGVFTEMTGAPLPTPAGVRIAHPWHLYQHGQLAAWQQEIVRRKWVQPFKQAFRELYVLTPAEEESVNTSQRFAGHVLDPRVVTRLLQARGWTVSTNDDNATPYKIFQHAQLVSYFSFPDAFHFLSETEAITSDELFFLPYPQPQRFWDSSQRVPLAMVPPVIFSEVMRDADLLVSVSQRGDGEAHLSEEAYLRRGELVTALLTDLGLPGVTIDGHHAHITGKLANYRVHLGSATIHIVPGNYLCVVPDRGSKRERLYLPFADQGDMKTSEVISKVLLLMHDDQITDQSILGQITRGGLR
jgi:hypothetical protein